LTFAAEPRVPTSSKSGNIAAEDGSGQLPHDGAMRLTGDSASRPPEAAERRVSR
jgi:hypothetical protein